MNGIPVVEWIEQQTKGYCNDRKLAFIKEIIDTLNEYNTDLIIENSTKDA